MRANGRWKAFFAVVVFGAGSFSGALLPRALGDGNSTSEAVLVTYRDYLGEGGPPHECIVTQYYVGWNPNWEPWCGDYTAAGNRFYHAHTVGGFPFTDTGRNPNKEVTAAMSDYYWDKDYYSVEPPPDAGWDRKVGSTSTMAYNCHGYAMSDGLGAGEVWLAHGGDAKVIEDDYTLIGNPQVGCIVWAADHSYKVLGVRVMDKPPFPWDFETHMEEKNMTSAVYVFKDSLGVYRGNGCWYKKK